MQREAKLLRGFCDVIVAGSDNSTLALKIEAAVERGARAIVSFGICGALSPELAVGSIIVGTEVASGSERWRADDVWANALTSACNPTSGVVVGSDSILLTEAAKAELHERSASGR